MLLEDVKVGQKVQLVSQKEMFYSYNITKSGVVVLIEGDYVHVMFEDGKDDFGYASGLELVEDVVHVQVKAPTPSSPPEPTPASVKEAITDVEKALAVLKALVG